MKKIQNKTGKAALCVVPLFQDYQWSYAYRFAYSHAKSSNIVNNESVQSILQGRTIKGQIIDENNEPLIGVSVTVKGANTIGTITDFDGNYTLDVPAGKTVLKYLIQDIKPKK